MPFEKGTSGNPKGNPKGIATREQFTRLLRDLCQKQTQLCVDKLIEMISDSSDRKTQLAAIGMVLDRGFGKPQQAVSAEVTGGLDITVSIVGKALPDAK